MTRLPEDQHKALVELGIATIRHKAQPDAWHAPIDQSPDGLAAFRLLLLAGHIEEGIAPCEPSSFRLLSKGIEYLRTHASDVFLAATGTALDQFEEVTSDE